MVPRNSTCCASLAVLVVYMHQVTPVVYCLLPRVAPCCPSPVVLGHLLFPAVRIKAFANALCLLRTDL